MSVENLLDMELDDLEDLPEFKPFPNGAYVVSSSFNTKEMDDHGECPELTMTCIQVIELEDPSAEPPAVGDTSSCLFMMDNEFGRGKFKAVAAAFAPLTGQEKPKSRDVIQATKDIQCTAILSVRADRKDKDRFYQNIKEIVIN